MIELFEATLALAIAAMAMIHSFDRCREDLLSRRRDGRAMPQAPLRRSPSGVPLVSPPFRRTW